MDTPARPLLTIGYSSLADRAPAIEVPTGVDDVEILVCVQGELEGPPAPEWDRTVHVPGVGVARSRNAAIDNAAGRFLLFCDDDVQVDMVGVRAAVAHLQRTGAAAALGRARDTTGQIRKKYRRDVERLTLFNSAKAATYEMLVDVDQVRALGVRFDERFGAGVEWYLGDEYIFLADLLRAGGAGWGVPFVFGTHPDTSSGTRWGGADAVARAVVLRRVFGRLAVPVRLAFGARHRSELGGWAGVWKFATHSGGPTRGTLGTRG